VPVLILFACALMAFKDRLTPEHPHGSSGHLVPAGISAFFTGIYGGYFGAAQGVLLMAILGIGVADSLQRHNATKNVLALVVNLVAALVFIAVADVDWAVAGLIAVGSVIGGQLGANVGRRLPANVLRGVIVVVGLTALVTLLWP
jgi:uncharacterized membrane protein YfcA